MKLVVLGKPKVGLDEANNFPKQKVVVTYDPRKEVTTVDCDVDIVTLGITVNVLLEQYNAYLSKLQLHVAEQIRNATRKAVKDYEEYSGKSTES
jgi:hypothetical protein